MAEKWIMIMFKAGISFLLLGSCFAVIGKIMELNNLEENHNILRDILMCIAASIMLMAVYMTWIII